MRPIAEHAWRILVDVGEEGFEGASDLLGVGALETDLGICGDGETTLEAVRSHRPDVLVLDIRMPGRDGLEVLRAIKEEGLPTRVVLLTAALDEDEFVQAVRLGVRGVVLKEMAPQLLVQCVRKVHAGEEWLEKRSVSRALEKMMRREEGTRELEVVRLVTQGLRNKEIATRLSITEGTVKIHLHKTYEKLHVDRRMELMLFAREKGLV